MSNEKLQSFLESHPDLREVTVDRLVYDEDPRRRDQFNSDNRPELACRSYDIIAGGQRNGGILYTDEEFLYQLSDEVRAAIVNGSESFPVSLGARL